MGTPLTQVVWYLYPVLVTTGMRLGLAVRVLSAYSCHSMATGSHPANVGMSCRSGALAASCTRPGSCRDIRNTTVAVALSVCAVVLAISRRVARAGSHCPRRCLWVRAVSTRFSSGKLGSSSHASGLSPVQTVSGVPCLSGVRSCSGHSGNSPSCHSLKLYVVAFSPHSRKACRESLSCRSSCLPAVAGLYFTMPRNQTHCLGCPFNEQTYTPCTSARSRYSAFFRWEQRTGRGFWLGLGRGRCHFGCRPRVIGPSGRCPCLLRPWPWFW